jgi:hypothetical protein
MKNNRGNDGIYLLLLIAIPLLMSIVIWVYQFYYYLRYSSWLPISVINALQWIGNENNPTRLFRWVFNPNDWIGLHNFSHSRYEPQ